jgi:hypothetical protein
MADGMDPELAKREIRATLFPGVFRQAVLEGRVEEADRDLWREMYLQDPDAFDFAVAYDFRNADSAEGSTTARELYLEETLRPPRPRRSST